MGEGKERITELEMALMDRNLWTLQDCAALMGPGDDRPAGQETGWRSWPEPSPVWYTQAALRARWNRN